MVYPLRSGITVRGPLGISSLGGANSTAGPVARAGRQHARQHRFVFVLGVLWEHNRTRRIGGISEDGRHHTPEDCPPSTMTVMARPRPGSANRALIYGGIGPADHFWQAIFRPPKPERSGSAGWVIAIISSAGGGLLERTRRTG
jgi:hypothetical protein